MQSRKNFENEDNAIFLPDEWTGKIVHLLHSLYQNKFDENHQAFEIYGMTFKDEVLLGTSLLSDFELPISYIVSCDLAPDTTPEKILDTLVDSIGVFFDNYFSNPQDFNDYAPDWNETQFKNLTIHYKVTRENIGLSLEASKLLKKNRDN